MGKDSRIGWVTYTTKDGIEVPGATMNPFWGCKKKEGRSACVNCYAESFSTRLGFDVWDGKSFRFFGDKHWEAPRSWQRKAQAQGYPMLVFSGSMCDIFYPSALLIEHRARLFHLIEETPDLIWLLLTKYPENVDRMVPWVQFPRNVMLLATIENQSVAVRDVPLLLGFRDRVRWLGISVEPMLGPLDFLGIGPGKSVSLVGLDWVIFSGESEQRGQYRTMEEGWLDDGLVQCDGIGIPAYVKQMGTGWAREQQVQGETTVYKLGDRKGEDPTWWPEWAWVKQFPDWQGLFTARSVPIVI